jgi:hypothetical protein
MNEETTRTIVALALERAKKRPIDPDEVKSLALARVRAQCYYDVVKLDFAKRNGNVFPGEDYDKALARIRDYGIMNGLKAVDIDRTFRYAHAEATWII